MTTTNASVARELSPSPVRSTTLLTNLGRALRHHNYRLYFAGQFASQMGTFLSQAASMWLVFRLTHSSWLLGLVGFLGNLPLFLLTPFAGVWVDRLDRRRLMLTTQFGFCAQSSGLLVTAWLCGHDPHLVVPLVIGMTIVQGMANAFDMPGRQAFLVEMISEREDLPNAIALNSTMLHAARLIGPAMAGMIIAHGSELTCFLLSAVSYFVMLGSLLAMKIAPRAPKPPRSVMLELREGIAYVWRLKPIRVLIALLCLLSLIGMPALTVLMPIFGDHFGGAAHGAQTFGFLSAGTGLGALCGALYLAARQTVKGLTIVIAVATTTFGVALLGFSQSPGLALAMGIVVLAGWGGYTSFATANTILQSLTDDHMRGRVMSFFSMAFVGMAPLGTLLAGFAAKRMSGGGAGGLYVGATRTVLVAGLIVLGAALLYIYKLPKLRALIRPVYRRKGILPEVADGLRAADILSENGEE